jgi:hypothetical protein
MVTGGTGFVASWCITPALGRRAVHTTDKAETVVDCAQSLIAWNAVA